jgi:peptidase M28-like protein/PDZ domain-containing protein/PA domain-containing protein
VSRRRLVLPLGLALALFGALGASARGPLVPPTAQRLAEDVAALAAPDMEGRRSGTPGGDRAARRIAEWLEHAGLRPGGEHGTYVQPFVIERAARLGSANELEVLSPARRRLEAGRDFTPHGGSPSAEVIGDVIFAGHGGSGVYGSRDDWAGLDVRGKIVLVLDGPQGGARVTRLEKLLAAKRRGASALLIVGDTLPSLDATAAAVPLVSATLTREAAAAFVPGARARLRVDLGYEERRGVNVVGILPGTDPVLAAEAVVVGAHYDHLGYQDGVLHPGADDNASGTAVVVGLARAFASAGGAPRTLVFALFGGEELGLLGSGHYVRQPAIPLAQTAAMLNVDMVGRIREDRLIVYGAHSGSGLGETLAAAAARGGVTLDVRGSPDGGSDHSRFYEAGVPVLFFTDGGHPDYHRPTDTADRIDATGMARVAAVALHAIERLAGDARPGYVRVMPSAPRPSARGGASGDAFLGVAVDARATGDGLKLLATLPESAAARAGLRSGDVLIRFAGVVVESLEALRREVQARKPGERVEILYLRDDETREAPATLGVRR